MLKIDLVCLDNSEVLILQRPVGILLINRVEGILKVGKTRVKPVSGRAFLLKSDQQVILEGNLLIGHLIAFQQVLLDRFLQQNMHQLNKGLFDMQAPLPFADSDDGSLRLVLNLMTQLIDEIKLASHRVIFQPYLFLLLWHLNRKVAEKEIKPTAHDSIVSKFKELLELHYIEQRNAPFYAGLIGINSRKLQYVLHKMTGKTFSDYWQERIYLEADLMLHDPEIPLKEIAYVLGYSGQSHFTRKYTAYKGMPPGKYRKEIN